MERRFQRKSFAPVQAGDEIDVKIEAVGAKGDGIAKVKGFVIFVPGTKEGETIKVRITKVFKKVAFGEVAGESTGKIEESSESDSSEESSEEQYNDE